MSATTTQPTDRNAEIAAETFRQIDKGVLMSLGMHERMRDGADLTFKAKIIPDGMQRARVMRVTVHLNGKDLYDVKVIWTKTKFSEILTHREVTDLDTQQLNRWLLALDDVL